MFVDNPDRSDPAIWFDALEATFNPPASRADLRHELDLAERELERLAKNPNSPEGEVVRQILDDPEWQANRDQGTQAMWGKPLLGTWLIYEPDGFVAKLPELRRIGADRMRAHMRGGIDGFVDELGKGVVEDIEKWRRSDPDG